MSKLTGILAVAGTSLIGAAFVLGAMHFRDSAEVPKWTPPSASLAPMMAGLAEPPPAPVAPRIAAAPVIAPTPVPTPAPVVAAVIPPAPPPPPPAAVAPPPPTTIPVAEPAPAQNADDDDEVTQAQAEQVKAMQANRLHALDLRSKRMMTHPRFNGAMAPGAAPAPLPELR